MSVARADASGVLLLQEPTGAVLRPDAAGVLAHVRSHGAALRADACGALRVAGLAPPSVTPVAYTAEHGATVLSVTTSRSASVRAKATAEGYGDRLSEWTEYGTTHEGIALQTAGGVTWTIYLRATAASGRSFAWCCFGTIDVPPRGDPPIEGNLDWEAP